MSNIFIIVILLVLLAAAIVPTRNHFKGQGGCCGGGGSVRPSKKKLDHVIAKKEFAIEGMHCQNCCNRIMEKLNDIPGVSAEVILKKEVAVVSYAKEVEDSVILEKIQEAGYVVRQ